MDAKERATVSMSGGTAGPDHCLKHQVPLVHTITERTLCAMCESWKVTLLTEVAEAARAHVSDHEPYNFKNCRCGLCAALAKLDTKEGL